MHLKQLDVHGLRNLCQASLHPSATANLIFGANGSGKTSLLEAIHLLGRGRSFRTRNLKSVINSKQGNCTVFGSLAQTAPGAPVTLGVNRTREGEFTFKVAGQQVNSASKLAETLPLLLLNSHSFQLLEGGPQNRRRFLDWGVFHVEHQYRNLWQRYQRCLKHRNSLLRHGRIDNAQLAVWDQELSALAEQMTAFRQEYLARLIPVVEQVLSRLSTLSMPGFSFYPGWDSEKPLLTVLAENRARDSLAKTTHHGPHRADLRIRQGNKPAAEVMSRGQIKVLVSAMQIAQGYLYKELMSKQCIYLLDDLPAELDKAHCRKLCLLLQKMSVQVFITGIEQQSLLDAWPEEGQDALQMFHVEQGMVVPCST